MSRIDQGAIPFDYQSMSHKARLISSYPDQNETKYDQTKKHETKQMFSTKQNKMKVEQKISFYEKYWRKYRPR